MDSLVGGNAVIREAYGIDPDTLSDTDWAKRLNEWKFIRRIEREELKKLLNDLIDAKFPTT